VPIFPQLPSRLAAAMGNGRANPQSEDAFFLNVWSPADAQGLPVMLFLHGGAWMTGGGAMAWYDGSRLAAKGLVVINVNYRLGALGHLGQPSAHPLPIPAADILLALNWLMENVRAFGGDPAKLTLAGQSSGGWYAHLLSCLPQTQGMIHRVALLSMGTRTPWLPHQQIDATLRAARNVGGDLLSASVDEALKAGLSALIKEPPRLGHAPSGFLPVASAAVPARLLDPVWAAQACHAEAVYLRYTSDEAATFFFNAPEQLNASQAQVDEALSQWPLAELPPSLQREGAFCGASSGLSPYRQLVAAASWRQFQRFPSEYAARLQQEGKVVQLVHFQTESILEGLHSGHCFDLPFQFGNLSAWTDAPMLAGLSADSFGTISETLISGIAKFAQAKPAYYTGQGQTIGHISD
jgi:para-nitrobenzyl esterase